MSCFENLCPYNFIVKSTDCGFNPNIPQHCGAVSLSVLSDEGGDGTVVVLLVSWMDDQTGIRLFEVALEASCWKVNQMKTNKGKTWKMTKKENGTKT